MTTKTTPILLDDFFDCETDEDLAVNDEKMDAAERNLRVLINTHAKEERKAEERKANETQKKARHRARVKACYRRLVCCALAAVAAYILTQIEAVSPVTALVIAIAALIRTIPELYWITRKTILFWTKKEGKHGA